MTQDFNLSQLFVMVGNQNQLCQQKSDQRDSNLTQLH